MAQGQIEKIYAGLYRVVGVTHTDGACGGEIWIERSGSDPSMRWESFCHRCQMCDVNGWATPKEALAEVPEAFTGGDA